MPGVGSRLPLSFSQGRRPLLRGNGSARRQESEPLSRGPQLILRPGGGVPASGRSAALVRAPVTARTSPGEAPGRFSGRNPRPPHLQGRGVHTLAPGSAWLPPGEPKWSRHHALTFPACALPFSSGAHRPHWPSPPTRSL